MKVGDKVKFIGDLNAFLKSFQPILKRTGEIITMPDSGLYKGKVQVRWIPKNKRGYPEYRYHRISELEIINEDIERTFKSE